MNLGATWNISITFLFGEYLMEYHWRTLHSTCAYFFGSLLELSMHIFFEPLPNKSITGHFVHEPGATWKHFNYHFFLVEFLMEYQLNTLHSTCAYFFGSPLELSMHIFFEPLPNKFITGHFVHEPGATWNISITFLFGWVSHGVPLKTLHSTCAYFLVHYYSFRCIFSFEPLPKLIHNRPFVHEHGGHMKHFNYISFWWVSHGVPLKTLHSTCAYFFWFNIRAFDAYSFWTFAK